MSDTNELFSTVSAEEYTNKPLTSLLLHSPVLPMEEHINIVNTALEWAKLNGKIKIPGPTALELVFNGVFSLAQYQSPFKLQNDRGTCWAFAGAAALEAAYRRKFNILIDVSEEYIFHIGKAFAINIDTSGNVLPVENNSSLNGFQGSGNIAEKLSENAVPPEGTAPYLTSEQSLLDILPVLGYTNQAALINQEDFDAIEFCEQHIPLLARVNARYRGTDWYSLGSNPSIESLENTLLSNHEVISDVAHKTPPVGGHVLLLIGFDRNRRVFFAKNHWGENKFIEIKYENDPNWMINSGWYIKDVVDPTYVQNEACWLGNWAVNIGGRENRMLLRRTEDFNSPGNPTRLGSIYMDDGRHDVNGQFYNNGAHVRLFISPTTAPTQPGTIVGKQIDAYLDFSDIYNASGWTFPGQSVTLSRFVTKFAALFEKEDGTAWQARHGIDSIAYQQAFDTLTSQGYRLTSVCGYSEGREGRFNAIWQQRSGGAWQARHGLTAGQYQATFNDLVSQGYRLTNISGYAVNGQARYAAIWEQKPGPDWQAHHGMTGVQYQQIFNDLAQQGYVLTQICGYRVNVNVLFAGIWEKQYGVTVQVRHGLTSREYQKTFNEMLAAGFRLSCVSGYSDTGIARYAGIWRKENYTAWQARHGMDAIGYQRIFDELRAQGYRPVQVSGYGDGFYPA